MRRPLIYSLALHAVVVAESKGMRWEISTDSENQITRLLAERLGLVVEAT